MKETPFTLTVWEVFLKHFTFLYFKIELGSLWIKAPFTLPQSDGFNCMKHIIIVRF